MISTDLPRVKSMASCLPQAAHPSTWKFGCRFLKHNLLSGIFVLFAVILAAPNALLSQEIKGFEDAFDLKPGRAFLDRSPTAVVTSALSTQTAKAGDSITLSITVEIPKGSHIYSMNPQFNGASKVKFEAEEGVMGGAAFVADQPPKVEFIKEFDQNVEKYKAGTVTFSRKYKVKPDAQRIRIQGILTYQICDDASCKNLKFPFEEEAEVIAGDESAPSAIPARGAESATAETSNSDTEATTDNPQFTHQYTPRHKRAITTIRLVPADAQAGDEVKLEVQVDLAAGWHTFTTTLPEGRAATATELEVDVHDGLTAIDEEFKPDREHTIKQAPSAKVDQEIYESQVVWSRRFKLNPGTELSQIKLQGSVAFQVCDEKKCIPAKPVEFEFPMPGTAVASGTRGGSGLTGTRQPGGVGAGANTAEPEQTNPIRPEVPGNESEPTGNGVVDLSGTDCVASEGDGAADIRDKGVIYVLGAAFVFGLLALLTPCVFPMVPITVSFFLKQAERRHSSPLKLALVYSGSIILTFTILGLVFSAIFGATYVNTLANGIWLNLFLGFVLLFFSLNLLGLFDIAVPSWLLTFTGNKESSGGYLGVFFMALTFTLTSFTCTFAFLGLILVWAANGEIWWPLAGLISFSTAFALPFFLLALFPSYLHKLPKSGGWMNRVKVVMGFIEMAFMLKFLSVADIAWFGGPTILDYHMVMTAWMVLAAITGMYLIGKIRLPHDTPTEYTGVLPMVTSMLFFGLAAYIGVGLFGQKAPEGFLGRQIAAFAPPQLEGGTGPDGPYLVSEHDKQRYLLDFEAAKRAALRENKPLFVDFTGVNCINCRLMETEVLSKDPIQKKMENCIRVQLYCDVMPSKAISDSALADKLVAANNKLQEEWLGDASLPAYVVVSPDGKTILSKVAGRVSSDAFSSFMTCGVSKFGKIQSQTGPLTAAK